MSPHFIVPEFVVQRDCEPFSAMKHDRSRTHGGIYLLTHLSPTSDRFFPVVISRFANAGQADACSVVSGP